MQLRAPKNTIAKNINLPLRNGQLEAIDAALLDGEKRVAFIRTAIENELKRRRRAKEAA